MKNKSPFEMVREFHYAFGVPAPVAPRFLTKARERLRVNLILEEVSELQDALLKRDIVAVADALGDIEYVVQGMAIEHGIPLPDVVAEIHRSNMTKLDSNGRPILREDGKILKGAHYEKPDLERVLYGKRNRRKYGIMYRMVRRVS